MDTNHTLAVVCQETAFLRKPRKGGVVMIMGVAGGYLSDDPYPIQRKWA